MASSCRHHSKRRAKAEGFNSYGTNTSVKRWLKECLIYIWGDII